MATFGSAADWTKRFSGLGQAFAGPDPITLARARLLKHQIERAGVETQLRAQEFRQNQLAAEQERTAGLSFGDFLVDRNLGGNFGFSDSPDMAGPPSPGNNTLAELFRNAATLSLRGGIKGADVFDAIGEGQGVMAQLANPNMGEEALRRAVLLRDPSARFSGSQAILPSTQLFFTDRDRQADLERQRVANAAPRTVGKDQALVSFPGGQPTGTAFSGGSLDGTGAPIGAGPTAGGAVGPSVGAVGPSAGGFTNVSAFPATELTYMPVRPQLARRVTPELRQAIIQTANRYGVPPNLVMAVMEQESGFRPHIVSPAGAYGLMQIIPSTARYLGIDPRDPMQNLDGGVRYLREQLDRFGGDVERALAAYNAGPNHASLRAGRIPNIKETQDYVRAIMGRLGSTARAAPAPATAGVDTRPVATPLEGDLPAVAPAPAPAAPATVAPAAPATVASGAALPGGAQIVAQGPGFNPPDDGSLQLELEGTGVDQQSINYFGHYTDKVRRGEPTTPAEDQLYNILYHRAYGEKRQMIDGNLVVYPAQTPPAGMLPPVQPGTRMAAEQARKEREAALAAEAPRAAPGEAESTPVTSPPADAPTADPAGAPAAAAAPGVTAAGGTTALPGGVTVQRVLPEEESNPIAEQGVADRRALGMEVSVASAVDDVNELIGYDPQTGVLDPRGYRPGAREAITGEIRGTGESPIRSFMANVLQSEQGQRFDSARFAAIEPLLRLASGAATPEQEVARYREYLPMPGDTERNVLDKARRFNARVAQMRRMAAARGISLDELAGIVTPENAAELNRELLTYDATPIGEDDRGGGGTAATRPTTEDDSASFRLTPEQVRRIRQMDKNLGL